MVTERITELDRHRLMAIAINDFQQQKIGKHNKAPTEIKKRAGNAQENEKDIGFLGETDEVIDIWKLEAASADERACKIYWPKILTRWLHDGNDCICDRHNHQDFS